MSDKPSAFRFLEVAEACEFPSSADRVFAPATTWEHSACLNGFPNVWAFYALGYKRAADILVGEFAEMSRGRDPLVFPIVFLYRQFLELSLKDLIRQARCYLECSTAFPAMHELDKLWRKFCSLLSEINSDAVTDEMRQIERLIDEFCAIDPISQAFRYPEDKQGNPSLPNMNDINVVNVRDVVSKMALLLECVDAMVEQYQSAKNDIAGAY